MPRSDPGFARCRPSKGSGTFPADGWWIHNIITMKNNNTSQVERPVVGNPARRRFISRLSRTATAAVPLAMVAAMGLPKAQAY